MSSLSTLPSTSHISHSTVESEPSSSCGNSTSTPLEQRLARRQIDDRTPPKISLLAMLTMEHIDDQDNFFRPIRRISQACKSCRSAISYTSCLRWRLGFNICKTQADLHNEDAKRPGVLGIVHVVQIVIACL